MKNITSTRDMPCFKGKEYYKSPRTDAIKRLDTRVDVSSPLIVFEKVKYDNQLMLKNKLML